MLLGGIDEAGRGCICGSLFVAGVIASDNLADSITSHLEVKDSKMLSAKKRESIAKNLSLMRDCGQIEYCIVKKTADEIDKYGLSAMLKSALESIMQILSSTTQSHIEFTFDGNTTFGAQIPTHLQNRILLRTQIKADKDMILVSCASILAKVSKDKEMQQMDRIYPQYDFAKNKGYGTKAHKMAIEKYGLCPHHRKSFKMSLQKSLFHLM